jgi:hypothetical protein
MKERSFVASEEILIGHPFGKGIDASKFVAGINEMTGKVPSSWCKYLVNRF